MKKYGGTGVEPIRDFYDSISRDVFNKVDEYATNAGIEVSDSNIDKLVVESLASDGKSLHGLAREILSANGIPMKAGNTNDSNVEYARNLSREGLGALIRDLDEALADVNRPIEHRIPLLILRGSMKNAQLTLVQTEKAQSEKLFNSLQVGTINQVRGELLASQIEKTNTLSNAMDYIQSQMYQDDIGARVIARIKQLAIDNDTPVRFLSVYDMEQKFGRNTAGAYDNETGIIYVARGTSYNDAVHAITHEAVHAHLNKKAFGYHNYAKSLSDGETVIPQVYGLTAEDVAFFADAERIMGAVRGSEVFSSPKYADLLVSTDALGNKTPYGLSYDATSKDAVVEFAAEMFSSPRFRQAVTEALAKKNETNLSKSKNAVVELFRKLARLFGFYTKEDVDTVADFIDSGMRTLSAVPYIDVTGRSGASNLKSARTKSEREKVLRYVVDQERGIQYYTFKRPSATNDGVELGEASAYRMVDDKGNLTDKWSFSYRDDADTWTQLDGLSAIELGEKAADLGLEVLSRNGNTRINKHVNEQIDRIWALHPVLAKALIKVRQWVASYAGQENADDFMDKFVGFAMKMEYYTQDRDVLLTWATRMAVAKYGKDNVPSDLQNEANIIRAEYNNFFNEHGVGGRITGLDRAKAIRGFIDKYGWSDEFARDVVYARMAQERTRQFKENPGGLNPYTGEHWRDTNVVSGFKFTDKNGNRIADEDGTKFFASLDVEQQRQVNEFVDMWIAQNNAVLDLEYQSGVLSSDQYKSMYNVFYAPLKNEWDKETAFYKMARGRRTEAKDPFTNWYAHAEMRVSYALRQREHQMLLEMGQQYGLDKLFVVNQSKFVGRSDTIGKQWQAPNMSDGSSWSVYKNGIRHTLTINDPVLKQIYRNTRGWENKANFWSVMAGITRAMSAVRTTFSPAFLPVAYARDLATAVVNVQAAFRSMTGSNQLSNAEAASLAPKVVKRSMASVFGILKGKWTDQRSWQYDVFKRYGGGVVMNARMDFDDHNAWLADNVFKKGMSAKQMAVNTAKKGALKMSQISHALEDSVRFATFMEFVEMKAGRKFNSEQELVSFLEGNQTIKNAAVNGSKNITGNFEIKSGSTPLRSLFMFFNAGMVGARTFVHMFDPGHGTHGIKMASMIFGLALASLAMMDDELGEDDDGKSKTLRIRATETGLCMGMSGCVQMPHELHWVMAMAKATYHSTKGDIDMADGVGMVAKKLFQTFVPLSFGPDMTTGSDIAMGLLPTVLQPFAQNILNRDAFGNPIVSEFAYNADGSRVMDAPDWMKSKISDPELFKTISLELNRVFGADISASEITHGFQQTLGGVGSALLKVMRGLEGGKSPSEITADVFASGFIPRYDNGALKSELQDKIASMKSALMRGPDASMMVLGKDELQNNDKYNKLVELEKRLTNGERSITYNGKSYAEMFRQKMAGMHNGDIDAILEADNALDIMGEQRRALYGEIINLLEELSYE